LAWKQKGLQDKIESFEAKEEQTEEQARFKLRQNRRRHTTNRFKQKQVDNNAQIAFKQQEQHNKVVKNENEIDYKKLNELNDLKDLENQDLDDQEADEDDEDE